VLRERAKQLRFWRRRRELGRAYRRVFLANPDGEAVLRDLMRFGHFGEPVVSPGQSDVTAFRDGERNVVLRILKMCGSADIDPEQLIKELDHDDPDERGD